ncbi:hypothetical protein BKA82DRAFT_4050164 [Pisolithus tinctorius]|nr:hypothetical protein BKA82DRAFT_4050164 [Pisolithus tinctorius]
MWETASCYIRSVFLPLAVIFVIIFACRFRSLIYIVLIIPLSTSLHLLYICVVLSEPTKAIHHPT